MSVGPTKGPPVRARRALPSIAFAVAGVLLIFAAATPTQAALIGTGAASALLGSFVEISVVDGSIAPLSVAPSAADPGPRAYSLDDGFTFSNVFTNTRAMFSLAITTATDGTASSTKMVQGANHTIADWIFVKQGDGTKFTNYLATGVYDANAAAYTAAVGFVKDSQGTFVVRYYEPGDPADGGDGTTTVNWIYDASSNKYMFDATDKDFTNGNGEGTVWPSSKADRLSDYTFPVQGSRYGVLSVGGAGSNYVPTVRQAWQVDFSALGSVTKDAHLLIDFPSGTPADTYSITLTATATQLTS